MLGEAKAHAGVDQPARQIDGRPAFARRRIELRLDLRGPGHAVGDLEAGVDGAEGGVAAVQAGGDQAEVIGDLVEPFERSLKFLRSMPRTRPCRASITALP